MTDLRTAAQQALEALEQTILRHDPMRLASIDAIRAALAQQAEPTRSQQMADAGFKTRDRRLECDECGGKFTAQMLPIHKCAQQAEPDSPERRCGGPGCDLTCCQQVQEPVAWMYTGIKSDGSEHGPHLVWRPEYMDAMSASKGTKATPLYTSPPQREPLTDEQISDLWHQSGEQPFKFARMISEWRT